MSTIEEHVLAQQAAWRFIRGDNIDKNTAFKHLLGPVELENVLNSKTYKPKYVCPETLERYRKALFLIAKTCDENGKYKHSRKACERIAQKALFQNII